MDQGIRLSRHTIMNSADLPIRIDLREREDRKNTPGIVICHGFKGFKDWGFFPFLAEELARAGFRVASFDFSHNGIGERAGIFDRLDLFESDTLSQQLDDAGRVIDWFADRGSGGIGLLGHSRGALVALVAAAERPAQIGAVVSWNGVERALRHTSRQLERWKREGRLEFTNARTGQRMSVGYGFVQDALDHAERLDPIGAGLRMKGAQLILHARGDLAVKVEAASQLMGERQPSPDLQMEILEGSGHTFGAVHPFMGSTKALDQAIMQSREWFALHLKDLRRQEEEKS